MTRALVIAPQWIGDAVMAEPLLAALAARGERLTVAALPWVAPVFRAMAAGRRDRSSCRSRTAASTGRARRRVARELRGRFDVAYVLPNSIKSALVPWLARHPAARRLSRRGPARACSTGTLPNPPGRPPMVAFYGALAGAGVRRRRGGRACSSTRRDSHAALASAGLQRGALLDLRARRRIRPGQALAGRALRGARALAARAPTARRSCCSARPAKRALCDEIAAAAPGACRVARRPDVAARRDGADRRVARPGRATTRA